MLSELAAVAIRLVNLLVLLLLLLPACSQKGVPHSAASKKWQVEYESPKDQALEEIKRTKTSFAVLHTENAAAWDRVYALFKFFLKTAPESIQQDKITGGSANFFYLIERHYADDNVQYQVTGLNRASLQPGEKSTLNAKNIARFIKNGTLEVDFLVK